jgi:hypothetical protein
MTERVLGIVLFLVGLGFDVSGWQSDLAAGLCMGAGIALAVSSFARWRPRPDDEAWRRVNRFRLGAAAALWVGDSPTVNLSDKGYAALQRLKQAVDSRELEAMELNGPTANMNTWVARRELMRYAVKHGEAPEFLFAEK